MASEDRSLSEFPRALQVAEQALVMISNPDGLGGYDTNSALLTEVGRAILAVQYTQQLGNVSVFDAIKNTRVLSGTTTPTANEGANGQLYVKYETVSNVDNVVGMYFKKDGAWLEISLGGGGNTDYIECTQAQYDAWEQGGTLDPDTLYFITDGNIGNDIIDDSTTSATKVWSSDKTDTEIQAVASDLSDLSTRLNGYIVSDLIYNQTTAINADTDTVITIPTKTGYTAIGLGVTYAGGTSSIAFIMDTDSRIHARNFTTYNFNGVVRVNVLYLKNS